MENNKVERKLSVINSIIVYGLLIANIIIVIKILLGIEVRPVYSNLAPFKDFTDVLKLASGKLGEEGIGNYFPFTYVFMAILEFISFGKYKILYFITVVACSLIYIWYCRTFLKEHIKKNIYLYIIIFLFLQIPMLYAFQRGNIEIIMLVFCMLFYISFKKEKYNLAAILLSFAICMKLYPALLAMLFISRKQYKAFFLCAGASMGITILSYILVQDILGGFTHYLSGFSAFLNTCGEVMGLQYNHSILFGIYYILYKVFNMGLFAIFETNIVNIYTICIIIIAIPLTLYATFKKMEDWKKLTIFVLMMVSFPQISFEYTLILLIIPIIEFVTNQNTKEWEDKVYAILLGLLLISMNINEEVVHYVTLDAKNKLIDGSITPNIGLIIKPIIIISIIAIIIISNANKIKINNKKEEVFSLES